MIVMKKWIMALITLAAGIAVSSAAWAGVFDNYVDYLNPDGTYSYYFDQGVLVTLDGNWYRNTFVKTGDRGATFYQKASYDAYAEEGLEGGRLFTIGASVNTAFSELPSFVYIGFDEDSCMNYYAELPTDYQAYTEDEAVRAGYDALWAEVRDVIAGIRIGNEIQAGSGQDVDDGNGLAEELSSPDIGEPAGLLPAGDMTSEKPYLTFSDWEAEPVSERLSAYTRDITVSDGGNYIMTYLDITGSDSYYFSYDAVWQGKGRQKVFSSDWDSEEIRIGKLFPFETLDECDMDIDQIITDHISIQASDGSSFILVFRPAGGEYDGTVQTVTVMNGRRDLTADSYRETEYIELLGVLRFPEEERSALHFGENIIQPDSTGFRIQMSVYADVNDGIALMVYTNSSGNEVCVAQPVIDGFGVLSAYDGADTVEEIKAGRFGIMGFTYNAADALIEGVDFASGAKTPDLNQSGTASAPSDPNLSPAGGMTGGRGQDTEMEPLAEGEHRITVVDTENVIVDCPEKAKAGTLVTVHTVGMADAEVVIEVNGGDIGRWQDWGTYTFYMPDKDTEVKAWTSTAGYPGA